MKAIILTAGRGSRLSPLTDTTPKTLLPIDGEKTILDKIFENIPEEITELIFVINYLGENIQNHIEKNYTNKIPQKISFVWQKRKTGTMGALLDAQDLFTNPEERERFLVMNGDEIHQKKEIQKILKENWAMAFTKKMFPKNYYTFDFRDNFVADFRQQTEKELKEGSYNFSGMTVLDTRIFSFPTATFSGDEIGLPQTILKQREKFPIHAVFEENWISVNTEKDLDMHRNWFNSL